MRQPIFKFAKQRLSEKQRETIAVRTERESLRALATEYGVSPETIRRMALQVN